MLQTPSKPKKSEIIKRSIVTPKNNPTNFGDDELMKEDSLLMGDHETYVHLLPPKQSKISKSAAKLTNRNKPAIIEMEIDKLKATAIQRREFRGAKLIKVD